MSSINSEINRIQTNIDNAFDVLENLYGVNVLSTDNSDDLATRIAEIKVSELQDATKEKDIVTITKFSGDEIEIIESLDIAELMESGSSDLTVQDLVNHHLYWADSHVQLVKSSHEMYLVAETLPETPTGDNVKIQRAVYLVQDSDSGVTVQFVGNSYIGLNDWERSSYESAVDSVTQLLTDVEELQLHVIILNYHEYVDLGLPSGTLWATCNVGANSPEEYGDYYAWGEIETKSTYNWSTYKWCNDSYNNQTKYCTSSSYGTVDNKTTLDSEDDVAHVRWGSSWRMPTKAEQDELCTKCTWTWTTQNGVNGRKVTGPNGNSIFLPAAGYRFDSSLYLAGANGYYQSSVLNEDLPFNAYELSLGSSAVLVNDDSREFGISIRPVCSKAPSKYIDDAVAAVKEGITDLKKEDAEIKESINDIESHVKTETSYEYVDLGLPSGTLWATCNVGATNPEDYGNYYAWGEVEEKDDYSWSTYKWCNGSGTTLTKYNDDSNLGTIDNKLHLDAEDDAAHVNLDRLWEIPGQEEFYELKLNCSVTTVTLNNTACFKITGPNGNFIIIPENGIKSGIGGFGGGSSLWLKDVIPSSSLRLGYAFSFLISHETLLMTSGPESRYQGFGIRPICKNPKAFIDETLEKVDSDLKTLKTSYSNNNFIALGKFLANFKAGTWTINDNVKFPSTVATTEYVDDLIGDIQTILTNIIGE